VGLDVPELADRDYDDLVEEARKLLPAYSEEWTNYNPQDPGIAILELLAHLTDTYTYQLDSVTDTHREKYLQLMDEQRRPPTAASARLTLDPPADASPIRIDAGTQLTVVDGSGTEKTFETDEGVVLTDASVERVLADTAAGRTDHSHANGTAGMFYRPLGEDPAPGDAMLLGLATDPFEAADALSITVDFHDEDLPAPAGHGDEPATFEPSVALVWEYCTDYAAPADAWEPFTVVRDGTDDLYEGGTVTLAAPEDWAPEEYGVDEASPVDGDAGLVWLRCRVETAGYEIPPQFDAVKLGVVTASNRRTLENERLHLARGAEGPSGLTAQRYHFEHAPVLDAEITVGGEPWTEVADLQSSGPTDRHYVLDRAAGVVEFGDGVKGRLPEPDERVIAERYVAGGGDDGNVPASANWRFADGETAADGETSLSALAVTPDGPATGGTDAESLPAAFRRVKRDLGTPYRAVTADDIEYLVRHTPGLRVGRATVLLADRPDANGTDVPPVARVVVVPFAPADVARPTPSEGFMSAVQAHLDRHRLLTDRVRAEAPTYVGIAVTVTVTSTERRPRPDGADDVERAIRGYLHPLHGADGDGWPFGRTLYAEGLADVLTDVEWVDGVESLSVTAPGNARVGPDGNVRIDEAALFALEDCTTTIETASGRAGPRGD
jgi:predicted phage baseplate assembly protein